MKKFLFLFLILISSSIRLSGASCMYGLNDDLCLGYEYVFDCNTECPGTCVINGDTQKFSTCFS